MTWNHNEINTFFWREEEEKTRYISLSIISQSIFIQQLLYLVIFHLHTDYTSIVFLFDILRQIKAYIYCFSYLYMNFWRELFKNLALNTKISKVCKFAGFNQNWTLKIFLPECVSCEKFHHQYIKNNLVGKTMYTFGQKYFKNWIRFCKQTNFWNFCI